MMKPRKRMGPDLILGCIVTLIFLGSTSGKVSCQNQTSISLGLGCFELCNLGIRYGFGQMQAGVHFGFLPDDKKNIHALSAAIQYHCWGAAKGNDMKPWFIKMALSDVRTESRTKTEHQVWLQPRLGREFWFNEYLGCSIDAGFGRDILFRGESKITQRVYFLREGFFTPVKPSVGLSIFSRF